MGINKCYAVLGLGRYGRAVAKELVDSGAQVIAVDSDERIVETFGCMFPICKCADITDAEALKQIGIPNADTVIIAIAGNLEAGVMATMLCKEMGVGTVVVKCSSDMHKAILQKVGADMVVFPEKDSGIRLAKNLLSSGFLDIADISEDISIIELAPKKEWVGKSLFELELRKKYGLNVIALNKGGKVTTSLMPDTVIREDTKMIVISDKKNIDKLK